MSIEAQLFKEIENLFENNEIDICSNPKDILPCRNEIDKVIEKRTKDIEDKEKKESVFKKVVKILEDLESRFNNIQLALKISANGLYGYTGTKSSRFYMLSVAEGITLAGQEESNSVINRLVQFGYYIIYSDTDSCFINVKEVPKDKFEKEILETDEEIKELKDKLDKGEITQEEFNTKFEEKYKEKVKEWIYNKYVPKINEISNDILNQLAYSQGITEPKYGETHFYHFKQEIVARSGIFIQSVRGDEAKKRYTLWIIDEEGVPKDKITCAGCPLKQSSFPKFVVDKFLDFANLLLKDRFTKYRHLKQDDFNKLLINFVFEYKKELEKYCDTWDIEKIGKYSQLKKPFEEYKSKDSFVKFCEVWNKDLSKILGYPEFFLLTRYVSIPVKLKKDIHINKTLKELISKGQITDKELEFLKKLVYYVKKEDIKEIALIDENDERLLFLFKLVFEVNKENFFRVFLKNIYNNYLSIFGINIDRAMKGQTKTIEDLI